MTLTWFPPKIQSADYILAPFGGKINMFTGGYTN